MTVFFYSIHKQEYQESHTFIMKIGRKYKNVHFYQKGKYDNYDLNLSLYNVRYMDTRQLKQIDKEGDLVEK